MELKLIRSLFLNYFQKKGHTLVPSSALIPHNDETLLFTNAGMVQFKEVFLGQEKRPFTRAASAQVCVRAGGKHNDLENVGYTARHHTFFEMLGNFSFGDYFKREAIQYAWEFITNELKIPPEKLWVTVYEKDLEAEKMWLEEIKVDKNRFSRCGESDNFWAMGETGPCGPCTEIFYDHGPSIAGGPPGSPDAEGDRYIEIWNLVFMQYNRLTNGEIEPLPKPSVDTGMGLERLAAVLQGVHSNYEIDLFVHLIQAAADLLQIKDEGQKSLRVIADHIRSTVFLMADGVIPSNEGRGYVLRRIMRRALRHGYQLGATQPFFYKLLPTLVQEMGEAYPKIKTQEALIQKMILREEEQFAKTLAQGLSMLEQEIKSLRATDSLSGEIVFKLYDTFGFPVDLTADFAREKGFKVDIAGFEQEMEKQRAKARQASQFDVDYTKQLALDLRTEFTGYHSLKEAAQIVGIYVEKNEVPQLKAGQKGQVLLASTPFYAESGGQVGDKGILKTAQGLFEVTDTKKIGEAIVHLGTVKEGVIVKEEIAEATVDGVLRQATRLNHSATHLLHAALREIIGAHVIQKGSLVAPDRLRFDYAHFEPLTPEQMLRIEDRVNEKILENTEATIKVMSPEEAIKAGAMALFGEKYGDKVRVLNMGHGYSVELCGGTHAGRTGDIGLFKITSESGIASGIRRIEAVTGKGALDWIRAQHLDEEEKIKGLQNRIKDLEKEMQRLKAKLAHQGGTDLSQEAIALGDVKLLVKKLSDIEPKVMRELMDDLKTKLQKAVIVLSSVNEGKVQIIVGVTQNCTKQISASDLANFVAGYIAGKGGGRSDLAQAGGNDPSRLDQALLDVKAWVEGKL